MRTAVASGVAVITEACLDVNDRSCVDVCPVQCIYEFDEPSNLLVSEMRAGSGVAERTHTANAGAATVFGASLLYVHLDECTSCAACLQTSVCPVGAIYAEGRMPDDPSLCQVASLAVPRARRNRARDSGVLSGLRFAWVRE